MTSSTMDEKPKADPPPAEWTKDGTVSVYKTDDRRDYVDVSALFGKYIAAWVVTRIKDSRIQVLEVTALAFVAGMAAALCITTGVPGALVLAAVLIQVKNILDTVDGSLARARRTPSALGRYADSVSDFLINAALFWAMAELLSGAWGRGPAYGLAGFAFLSQSLQCTYYVCYLVRFLNSGEPHGPLDARHPVWTQVFKGLYRLIYGWQDRLVERIDRRMGRGAPERQALFLNSFIGLGTQLFLMSGFLLFSRPDLYLWLMAGPMNLYLVFLIFYRRTQNDLSDAQSNV